MGVIVLDLELIITSLELRNIWICSFLPSLNFLFNSILQLLWIWHWQFTFWNWEEFDFYFFVLVMKEFEYVHSQPNLKFFIWLHFAIARRGINNSNLNVGVNYLATIPTKMQLESLAELAADGSKDDGKLQLEVTSWLQEMLNSGIKSTLYLWMFLF